jgi:hypothetical protein
MLQKTRLEVARIANDATDEGHSWAVDQITQLETRFNDQIDELWDHIRTAERVRQLPEERKPADAGKQACLNLVARLNGDGGHRINEVGLQRASEEAEERVIELLTQQAYVERLENNNDQLRRENARLRLVQAAGSGERG